MTSGVSAAFSPSLAFISVRKASVPLWAMVPRFVSSSSFVMPMPLSVIVSVRACLSGSMRISSSLRVMPELSVSVLK